MTQPNASSRDADVVDFIRGYRRARGFSPSLREIGTAVGLSSTSSIAAHINRLVRRGVLERTAGIPRSLVVVEDIAS